MYLPHFSRSCLRIRAATETKVNSTKKSVAHFSQVESTPYMVLNSSREPVGERWRGGDIVNTEQGKPGEMESRGI